MARLIDKTFIGKTYPKETNVHWIDTSGEEPISKYFINGKWRTVGGSGSGNGNQSDPEYSVTKQYVTVYEETVTTVIDGNVYPSANLEGLGPDDLVLGETYKVTFNGVEYELVCFDNDGIITLGAPFDDSTSTFDFSEYPFNIDKDFNPWGIITPEEGTYTVKIEHLEDVVETSDDFKSAVNSVTELIVFPDEFDMDSGFSLFHKKLEKGKIYMITHYLSSKKYIVPCYIKEISYTESSIYGKVYPMSSVIPNNLIMRESINDDASLLNYECMLVILFEDDVTAVKIYYQLNSL